MASAKTCQGTYIEGVERAYNVSLEKIKKLKNLRKIKK